MQKSLQEEVALRKEDPRPAPHPAHHVEEVLHLVPGPVTHGRVEVTLLAHDITEEVEKIIEIILNCKSVLCVVQKNDPSCIASCVPAVKSRCFRRFSIANCG